MAIGYRLILLVINISFPLYTTLKYPTAYHWHSNVFAYGEGAEHRIRNSSSGCEKPFLGMSRNFYTIIDQYSLLSKNSRRNRDVVCGSSSSEDASEFGIVENLKGTSLNHQQNQESFEVMLNRNDISSLIYKCWEGSVTSYFHFFFGALIPTIEYHILNPSKSLRILTDIGPFKSLLCEMPITILEMLAPNLAEIGKCHRDKSLFCCPNGGEICLEAYDRFNSHFYDDDMVSQMSKKTMRTVLHFFSETIPTCINLIPTFEIVLIQRIQENYSRKGCFNGKSVYRPSGSQRRSIRNHEALTDTLLAKYGPGRFSNVVLERSSIYYQYKLFRDAKVIIAQHGAALSNIFFMKPSVSHIIEFSPPWSREAEHFKNLSHFMGVTHHSIKQENDHSDVSINDVTTLLDEIYNPVL